MSSSRSPVDPSSAWRTPVGRPGGSSTTSIVPARRASAARRSRRSATLGGRRPPAPDRAAREAVPGRASGRSTRRRSIARPWTSAPAMASPSSIDPGVRTTSQSRSTPRATASTGSRLRARSSQATIEPVDCTSAARRRATVVLPLVPSPRTATPAWRGRPPGPRMASSAAKPVGTIRPKSGPGAGPGAGASARPGTSAGTGSGPPRPGSPSGASGSGTVARDPTTSPSPASPTGRAASPSRCGAAAPQRAWRDARAAVTAGRGATIGRTG